MAGPSVCVLAAGRGTRMGFADGELHKALAPLGNRAVLTHVLGHFPADSRFVVAVGHRADQIEAYLSLAHPDLDITLVAVDPYMGPGSGPGRSLLACAEHLTEPFALIASDTLVADVPELGARSWMGVSEVSDPLSFMTLEVAEDRVLGFQERTGPSRLAFVGLAWITEPATYLTGIERSVYDGELQVTHGFAAMVDAGVDIAAAPVDWLDTGTTASYEAARERFSEEPHGNRVATDVTYLLDDRVVKWFRDPAGADRRVARARDLGDAVPPQIASPSGWLAYEKVSGRTMRDRFDGAGAGAFVEWCSQRLWEPRLRGEGFDDAIRAFYEAKTLGRLRDYLATRGGAEPASGLVLGGVATPTVAEALAREIDGLVEAAVSARVHGDLHEGNIIEGPDGWRLIDWRDDVAGMADRGDQLYDLAKLLHTFELPESVMFAHDWESVDNVAHPDSTLRVDARAGFWRAAEALGVDLRAIGIVDALVFVNMAPLYAPALGDHLYRLGRWLLEVGRLHPDAAGREQAFTEAMGLGSRA